MVQPPWSGVPRTLDGLHARAAQASKRLLRDVSPYMPDTASRNYIFVNGRREDVSGAVVLVPELTLEALVPEPQALLGLMERLAGSSLEDLIADEVPVAECILAEGRIKPNISREEHTLGFVVIVGEHLGQRMVVNRAQADSPQMATIANLLKMGAAISTPVWWVVQQRLNFSVTTLALLADEFRQAASGKEGYKCAKVLMRCAKCGASERKEIDERIGGAHLMACAGCHVAFYCSRECQVAHWKEHKAMCKTAKKQAEAPSTNTSAASDGAGTSSSAAAAGGSAGVSSDNAGPTGGGSAE